MRGGEVSGEEEEDAGHPGTGIEAEPSTAEAAPAVPALTPQEQATEAALAALAEDAMTSIDGQPPLDTSKMRTYAREGHVYFDRREQQWHFAMPGGEAGPALNATQEAEDAMRTGERAKQDL